ncbi:MAG: hypothetical protein ACRDVF_12655 [Microbacterium sp.]
MLLIPGELILGQVRRRVEANEVRVDTAETKAETARATADAAKQQATQTAASLEMIHQQLADRQQVELDEKVEQYRAPLTSLNRESLLEALRAAEAEGLISTAGVRAPVWETEVHYRYVIDDPKHGALSVQLEEDDGTVIFVAEWRPGVGADEFFQELVAAVRTAGHDLGTGLNLPTESVRQVLKMLEDVTVLRSQALFGHRDHLTRIIERIDGWYFTEGFILPAEDITYAIHVHRLDEMDWASHLSQKGWFTAPWSIAFARRLYGISKDGDEDE